MNVLENVKMRLCVVPIFLFLLCLSGCNTTKDLYRYSGNEAVDGGFICFTDVNDGNQSVALILQNTSSNVYYQFSLDPDPKTLGDRLYFYQLPIGNYKTVGYLSENYYGFTQRPDTWPLETRYLHVAQDRISYIGTFSIKTDGFPFPKTHLKTVEDVSPFLDLVARTSNVPRGKFEFQKNILELKEGRSLFNMGGGS